jgi:RimJ/RimL family protein N-acetyltransferase
VLRTDRLILRPWHEGHRAVFAAMHADADVMADLGGPIDRQASDAKFDRYCSALSAYGVSRWAVEAPDAAFLGYAGVSFRPDGSHPLGPHHEVGWRFVRAAWGRGYASESARAALTHAFQHLGISRIFAYTSADNLRSQGVMRRLALHREPTLDFTVPNDIIGLWHGLVWVVAPAPANTG